MNWLIEQKRQQDPSHMQKQMHYTAQNLLVRPQTDSADPTLLLQITPEQAGWDYISFQVRRLATGESWAFATGEHELAVVNLTGRYTVESTRGEWRDIGGRSSVFTAAAHALYLPRRTEFTVTAEEAGEFAVTWVPTDQDHLPWLIRPAEVPISIRGGDNVSRQINDLLPPGSPVHRLVLVEVYTPSGNWSSYPGHKHDVHIEDATGKLIEADLEEVYYYQIDRPEGYAYQRVYTDERSPLHQAGYPIDALIRVEHNCAVLVPEGYHPVTSAPGYTTYYLNVLAGSAQSLANQDDPQATWVKHTYTGLDPRLPLYTHTAPLAPPTPAPMGAPDQAFWETIDRLVATSKLVIDRPHGAMHPRFPEIVYPLDYGYLENTVGGDGQGIDVWVGTDSNRGVTAVACSADLLNRDAEVKIFLGCTAQEIGAIAEFLNHAGQRALVIRRP